MENLAQSFFQSENPEERTELEKAIFSQSMSSSMTSSDDADDENVVGTGAGFQMPEWIANFFQGIVDRLQVHIRNITINLEATVPSENGHGKENVGVMVQIDEMAIEGVTVAGGRNAEHSTPELPLKEGKRLIVLRNIRGILISDASVFASLGQSSAMGSPNITHEDLQSLHRSPKASEHNFGAKSKESNFQSPSLSTANSLLVDDPAASPEPMAASTLSLPGMGQSVASSHRFDDASESGDYDDTPPNYFDESPVLSTASIDRTLEYSVFLEDVTDSQILAHVSDSDSDNEAPAMDFSFKGDSRRVSREFETKKLKESTPRASLYMPYKRSYDVMGQSIPPRPPMSPVPPQGGEMDMEGPGMSPSNLGMVTGMETADSISSSSQPDQPVGGMGGMSMDSSFDMNAGHTVSQIPSAPLTPLRSFSPTHHSSVDGGLEDSPASIIGEDFGPPSDTGSSSCAVSGREPLAESRFFSHDEAESMYASAFSDGLRDNTEPEHRMPGGWDESHYGYHEAEPVEQQQPLLHRPASGEKAAHLRGGEDDAKHDFTDGPGDESSLGSGQQTPVAGFPNLSRKAHSSASDSSSELNSDNRLGKQLFNLDYIGIYIPGAMSEELAAGSKVQQPMTQSTAPSVPGGFGEQKSTAQKARAREPSSQAHQQATPPPKEEEKTNPIDIVLGDLYAQFDVSVARLAYKLFGSLSDVFDVRQPGKKSDPPKEEATPLAMAIKLHVNRFSLKFLDRLHGARISELSSSLWKKVPKEDVLLRTTIKRLDAIYSMKGLTGSAKVTLQKFVFGYASKTGNILSFDGSMAMPESARDLAATAGVDVSIQMNKNDGTTRWNIATLPVRVSIDLSMLDETFGWFGGLSGVVSMTSSMGSSATTTTGGPTKPKPRGVRFDNPSAIEKVTHQNKVDARIGGFVLDLIGKECTVGLDTSALKMAFRESGIALAIDNAKLSGPHIRNTSHEEAIKIQIYGTRIEFLTHPQDTDLDRLLALITPSKQKYDEEDDIIVDVLLRQRKQGSVLRVTVDEFKSQVNRLDDLRYLPALGEELSKLSTVAKYLPEDDRPGLLSLVLVKDFDFSIDINNDLGIFRTKMKDIEAAQITLPALIALSMSTLEVVRNDKEEIIGPATSADLRQERDRAPAIMARHMEDKMNPMVKFKLWNLKAEYSVPLVMAVIKSLGAEEEITREEMAIYMTQSIANLAERQHIPLPGNHCKYKGKGSSNADKPPLTVDLAIRDCIIGLNPLDRSSKVLFVMTKAHLSATLPDDNNTTAKAVLDSGTLMVIDDVAKIDTKAHPRDRNKRYSFDGGSIQVATLGAQGFVSFGFITSGKVIVQVTSGNEPDQKDVMVNLGSELIVLESCADSTTTLIQLFGALAPPSPPSDVQKHRTDVMPMDDLMASFTGDAFGMPDGDFDFDEEFGQRSQVLSEDDTDQPLEFDEEYWQRSQIMDFTAHEPGSAPKSPSQPGSLLFDQDADHGEEDSVLVESFRSKQRVHTHEPLDFKEDHFGAGSVVDGMVHRWNSRKKAYETPRPATAVRTPLKVDVKDVNLIWNLHDGYDWPATREKISGKVQELEAQAAEKKARRTSSRGYMDEDFEFAEDETVIEDFLFNSIWIGMPSTKELKDAKDYINHQLQDDATETSLPTSAVSTITPSLPSSGTRVKGKRLMLERSKHHKLNFELKGVNVDFVAYPPASGETQSSIHLRVRDLDIYDHMATSTWHKFACYQSDHGPRQTGSSQVHIELLNVRPVQDLPATEMVLRATVLPLRLHVDQDALDFLTRFFAFEDPHAKPSVAGEQLFIQRAEINAIPVRLDFKPKRVDYSSLRKGKTTELMNFVTLESADMVMKHTILYGVSGFERLGNMLNDVWMPDIRNNQLPMIIGSVASVKGLTDVGLAVARSVRVPVREYRRDGKLVRAVLMGGKMLLTDGGLQALRLGGKMAVGTQGILETAEQLFGGPGDRPERQRISEGWEEEESEKRQISLYADQPVGVAAGLRGANRALQRDLLLARDAIIVIPGEVMESGSAVGALKAVAKRAPTVILRPMVGGMKAVGKVAMGVGNWADPGNLRRVEDVSNPFLIVTWAEVNCVTEI